MYILGISFGYHDASASLISDKKIIASSLEERFSRIKHDKNFPYLSIKFCLECENIDINDIEKVVFYEDTLLKFDRILDTIEDKNLLINLIDQYMPLLDIESFIANKLHINRDKVFTTNHHLSHISSHLISNFDESVILSIDGVGEYETLTIYKSQNNNLSKLFSKELPHSVGLLYSAFTAFLGFEVNEGEYKVMGLASYGKPIYKDKIYELLMIENGDFFIKDGFFDFNSVDTLYTSKFIEKFGTEKIGSDYDLNNDKYYIDIASSIQSVTEDLVLMYIKKAIEMSGINNVCLCGGVALNSVANEKIKQHYKNINLFVPPDPGDGGSSLFCALYYAKYIKKITTKYKLESPFLGKKYSTEELKKDIESNFTGKFIQIDDKEKFFDYVSNLLINNNVIGWFYGEFEWGPRALGHRSIIANPLNKDMKDIINSKIKFREAFRPFAPSILSDYAKEYFKIDTIGYNEIESYMLGVSEVFPDKIDKIPAVVHEDNTGRVQVVFKENNEMYYNLINSFYKKTGVPVILNTSYNLKGEPIVSSLKDAILTFSYSYMDYLVAYPFILSSFYSENTNNKRKGLLDE